MLADPPLVSEFAALQCAFEAGNDSFREHELLIGAVRQSVPPSRQRRRPHRPAPRDRVLVRKVIEIMQARLGERLLLEELAGVVGLTVFSADRAVQAHDWNQPACLPDAPAVERGLPPSAPRRPHCRGGGGGRVLRSECADSAFQALLRHDAAAICPGGRGRPQRNSSQYAARAIA